MTDWEKCIAFHGHSCGGLRIGYQAAQYARQLLQVDVSDRCASVKTTPAG